MKKDTVNILTIDVEDYFQVENFKGVVPQSDWGRYESRVEQNTDKLLEILSGFKAKATFFVLGWTAERYPRVVKKIADNGHEVASHGYAHELVYTQSPSEFKDDVTKSKKILESICQEKVIGYRAPTFSITSDSLWAFDILMENGFLYDASIFPARRNKGGLPQAECFPHTINRPAGTIWEFPVSMTKFLGKNIIFSGGGYFRLLPYGIVRAGFNKVNAATQPVVTYFHPWEFDPRQPRIAAGAFSSFKHYVNLSKTECKLKRLLTDFSFMPIRHFLEAENILASKR